MSISKFSLDGQVALVTGGGTGIGRAIALAFAEAGADVMVVSRRLQVVEAVAEEVRKMGRKGLAQSVDIRQIGQLKGLAEKVKTEFGRFDILVNNAGYSGMVVKAFDIDEAEWDRTMDLNLKGIFFLSKAAASIMKEQGGGNILNISSIAGIKRENWTPSPYAISKAGIEMLTKALAQEWARYNIRINCIAPGLIHSEMGDRTYDEPANKILMEQLLKTIAIRRVAQPEEIAGAALYLVSDASSYVTGVTIAVDGGHLIM